MSGGLAASPTVDAVRATAFTVDTTDDPEQDGTLTWDDTTMVAVEVDGGGRTGTGWTYAAPAVASLVTDVLAPAVCGMPVTDVRRAATEMMVATRNLGPGGLAAYARSAVDVALWDLKARVLDTSLVDLLGAARTAVPVYGSGGFTSLDDDRLAQQLHGWVEAGFTQVKIKVGRDPEPDRRRIAVARHTVGDRVALYVDANGGYQRHEALAWAEAFAQAGVTWLEEPVSSLDLAGLRLVRDRAPAGMAVAAGEYVDGLVPARQLLEAGAVDVLQLDATRCGGITGFLDAEAMARAHHVPVSAHCAPSLHQAVAAASPSLLHVEWFHDHARIERLLLDGFREPVGGVVPIDRTVAGHGLTLRPDADRHRTRSTRA